jgi:hypothetical protein
MAGDHAQWRFCTTKLHYEGFDIPGPFVPSSPIFCDAESILFISDTDIRMLWIFVSNTIPPITISSSTWCTCEHEQKGELDNRCLASSTAPCRYEK